MSSSDTAKNVPQPPIPANEEQRLAILQTLFSAYPDAMSPRLRPTTTLSNTTPATINTDNASGYFEGVVSNNVELIVDCVQDVAEKSVSEMQAVYDNLTEIAAKLFNVEMSCVSLIDRDHVHVKSSYGFVGDQVPRTHSFCSYTLVQDQTKVFDVQDASADPMFSWNPLVLEDPKIRFYAGVPIAI